MHEQEQTSLTPVFAKIMTRRRNVHLRHHIPSPLDFNVGLEAAMMAIKFGHFFRNVVTLPDINIEIKGVGGYLKGQTF